MRGCQDGVSPWAGEPHLGLVTALAPTPAWGLKGLLGLGRRTGEDASYMPFPWNSYCTFAKLFMVAICHCCPVLCPSATSCLCWGHQDRGWHSGLAPM